MASRDLVRLELTIGRLLRAGVMLSAIAMVVGLLLAVAGFPQGRTVLNGGLILLMMIPSTRIIVSLVDAVYRRDMLLSVSTAIVTAVIIEEVFRKLFFQH